MKKEDDNRVDPGTLRHVAKGAGINLAGSLGRTLMGLAFTFFLARVLPPGELGLYFLGFAILTLMSKVSIFGLDSGVVRYVALYNGEGDTARARGTVLSGLYAGITLAAAITILLLAGSSWISETIFHNSELTPVLRILISALPLYIASMLLCAGTQGLGLMRYTVFSRDLGEPVAKFIASMIFVALGAGVIGASYGTLIGATFMLAISIWATQKKMHLFGTGVEKTYTTRILLSFAAPLAGAAVLDSLLRSADTLLLGYLGTSEDVGLYGVPIRIGIFSTMVLISFSTMFAPVISDLTNRGKSVRLKALFQVITKWIIALSYPGFLAVLLFSSDILRLFGPEFTAASTAFIIVVTGQFINAATGPVMLMLTMSGHPRLELVNTAVATILNVTLCFILIPPYGMTGAAIGSALGISLSNIARVVEIYLMMGIQPYGRTTLKPLLAGALSAAMIVLLGLVLDGLDSVLWLATGLALLFGGYLVVLWMFGFDEDDKAVFAAFRSRLPGAHTNV